MNIKRIQNNFDKQLFNKKTHHPLQSWEWGEARKAMGIEVVRFGIFQKEYLETAFQFTLHPIPFFHQKIAYLPRSPYPTKEVLDFLHEYGKKNNLLFVKLEPYAEKKETSATDKRLTLSSHSLFPDWTQTMDIQPSEEELLSKMKSKTRYNIRLAEKKGVTVRELSNEEGFETFIKLYFETCKRQGYYGHTKQYHKTIWDYLKKDISHIVIAYFNNEPLAAYELFLYNNVMYYTYGGTSDKYRNLMPSNLLMWEAIRLGKKMGAVSFDMWGSLPPDYPQNHPWAGFTRFKEGYGTSFVRMAGSFDLVIDRSAYRLYNLLYKIRYHLLELKLTFFS